MALRHITTANLAVYKTRICPTAYALPMTNYHDNLNYIGMIKNKPHYKNYANEVFVTNGYNQYDYVADWLEDYKMLWTDYPEIWRLITINKKNYFFDLHHLDAYSYDFNKKLVYPVGLYCPKQNNIISNI